MPLAHLAAAWAVPCPVPGRVLLSGLGTAPGARPVPLPWELRAVPHFGAAPGAAAAAQDAGGTSLLPAALRHKLEHPRAWKSQETAENGILLLVSNIIAPLKC